jgi:HEAT repeat protein
MDLLQKGHSAEKKLALDNLWELEYPQYTQDPQVWAPILSALVDQDPTVREAAASFLKTIGEISNRSEHGVVLSACCGESAIVPSLINALDDKSPRVRAEAAAALGWYGEARSAQAVDPLIKRLKDPDPWVRLNAAFALGNLRASQAIDALMELLRDDSDWRNKYVQQEAIAALRKLLFVPHAPKEPRTPIIKGNVYMMTPDMVDSLRHAQLEQSPAALSSRAALKTLVQKSDDAYLKREIVRTFAVYPIPEAKEAIREALNDPDELTRQAASRVLAQLPVDRKIQLNAPLKSVDDPSPLVRAESARSLGAVHDAQAVTPLIKLLHDPDYNVRKSAVEALAGYKDDEKALTALAGFIVEKGRNHFETLDAADQFQNRVIYGSPIAHASTDYYTRYLKSNSTRKNGPAVAALLKALDQSDSDTHWKILPLLAQLDDERVTTLFRTLLNDASPVVRGVAIQTLKNRSITDFYPLLLSRLKDKDPAVRRSTIEDLEILRGDAEVKEALVPVLQDEDPTVRERAVYALGELREYELAEPLLAMFNDGNDKVRTAALTSLGKLYGPQTPQISDAALRMLQDPSTSVRQAALIMVRSTRDSRAVEPLLKFLNDDDGTTAGRAAETLGELGDPRAVEPLIEALNGRFNKGRGIAGNIPGDLYLREQSAGALGAMKEKRALPHLINILSNNNEDPYLRSSAARAIGMIGDPSALGALKKVMESGKVGDNMSYKIATRQVIEALSRKGGP